MILRRIIRYGIIFLVIILVLSFFSIHKHWDALSAYFASSISTLAGIGLYLLILGFGFWMLIRSLFR